MGSPVGMGCTWGPGIGVRPGVWDRNGVWGRDRFRRHGKLERGQGRGSVWRRRRAGGQEVCRSLSGSLMVPEAGRVPGMALALYKDHRVSVPLWLLESHTALSTAGTISSGRILDVIYCIYVSDCYMDIILEFPSSDYFRFFFFFLLKCCSQACHRCVDTLLT